MRKYVGCFVCKETNRRNYIGGRKIHAQSRNTQPVQKQ